MSTPIYVNLNYDQYKRFERQFAIGCKPLETMHRTEDERFYHKAIRFSLGDLEFEVTGPMVMRPEGQAVMSMAEAEAVASGGPPEEIPGSDIDPKEEAAHDAWVGEELERSQEEPNR